MCDHARKFAVVLLLATLLHPTGAAAQQETEPDCDDPEECARLIERLEREKPRRTSFFDRVHLDLLGAPPEIGGGSGRVGLVGAHLTIAEIGRLNVFGPPGVMVAMQSIDGDRSGRWRAVTALNWGVSVRLMEFSLGDTNRHTVMFLNLTKLWTWGDFDRGMDFVGLSFAWKGNGERPGTD